MTTLPVRRHWAGGVRQHQRAACGHPLSYHLCAALHGRCSWFIWVKDPDQPLPKRAGCRMARLASRSLTTWDALPQATAVGAARGCCLLLLVGATLLPDHRCTAGDAGHPAEPRLHGAHHRAHSQGCARWAVQLPAARCCSPCTVCSQHSSWLEPSYHLNANQHQLRPSPPHQAACCRLPLRRQWLAATC